MLHEAKEKRQVSFVDPLFIEREDEIACVGVQKIIGILNPFGNPFQSKNVAEFIVAKKAGKIRLIDFCINSHGASARLDTRAAGPRRALVLATPMQEVKRSRAIVQVCLLIGSICLEAPRGLRGDALSILAGFGDYRVGVGLDDAARHN
jgi:hypothetical protein